MLLQTKSYEHELPASTRTSIRRLRQISGAESLRERRSCGIGPRRSAVYAAGDPAQVRFMRRIRSLRCRLCGIASPKGAPMRHRFREYRAIRRGRGTGGLAANPCARNLNEARSTKEHRHRFIARWKHANEFQIEYPPVKRDSVVSLLRDFSRDPMEVSACVNAKQPVVDPVSPLKATLLGFSWAAIWDTWGT